MSNALSILLEKARSVPYYNKLWGKSRGNKLTDYPLSNKELFNPQQLSSSLSVPENDVAYYYFSAGSTGNPKMIPFTAEEWNARAKYRGGCYEKAGVTNKDKVAVLLSFGPWIAGPSAQDALLQIGCTVFPIGQLSEDEELEGLFSIFEKHKINVLITAPSLAQRFAYLYAKNNKGNTVTLDKVITSGELVTDSLREQYRDLFGAEIFSSYASSESFIGIECGEHSGFHYNPDELIVETLSDSSERTNEFGNTVITVLASEAVPIIRYPMGDLGKITDTLCSCKNEWPKIVWGGRSHESFSVAGQVSVHSYQIRDALIGGDIRITKCEIEIVEREVGKDLVTFNLYTITKLSEAELDEKKEVYKGLIKNSSMDFNDVVHQDIVELKVTLQNDLEPRFGPKMKIKVYDKRENVR